MAKRSMDRFDLEAEAEAGAISRMRSESAMVHTNGSGKRTLHSKVGYRKTSVATINNRDHATEHGGNVMRKWVA